MLNFKKLFGVRPRVAVGAFFIVFFIVGLSIVNDYGIHLDEYNNQKHGRKWTDYASKVVTARSVSVPLPQYSSHDLVHGPIVEIFLTVLTDHLQLKDSRDIILMRHRIVFLIFYLAVIFFYLLCQKHFQDRRLALLGCVFLILSPRIFADAFYNSVDIAFLSFFIIGVFTLISMLEKRTFLSALAHALVCAVLINIRLMGIFLLIFTVGFFAWETFFVRSGREKRRDVTIFIGYLFFFGILTILFNPLLWVNPLAQSRLLMDKAISFRWGYVRYFGEKFKTGKIPWHYALVWITVSTPLLYVALFVFSIFEIIWRFLENVWVSYPKQRNVALFFIWFFLPLIMSTGMLYNGWRHIYFIYPAMLLLAVTGFQFVWQNVRPVIRGVFMACVMACLLDTTLFMVRNHPYQHLYFNLLAGKSVEEITHNFDLDYWVLSTQEALEYILKTDKDDHITVYLAANPYGRRILRPNERERIVSTNKKPKYFLSRDMNRKSKYYEEECYSVKVDGMKVMNVYKLNYEIQMK